MRSSTAALLLLLASTGPALAQQTGIEVYNDEWETAWQQSLRAPIEQLGETEFEDALKALSGQSGRLQYEVLEVHHVDLQFDRALGLTHLDSNGFGLRFPVQGGWRIEAKFRLRTRLRVGPIRVRKTFNVEARLTDIAMGVSAEFDQSDPHRPRIQRLHTPDVSFELRLDSSNTLVDWLFAIIRRPLDRSLRKTLAGTLQRLGPQLALFQGTPGAVPGDGALAYTDSGTGQLLPEVVRNVDRKLVQRQMPYGITIPLLMDTAQTDSWEEAYRNGGPGLLGQVRAYHPGWDCCMWTAHFLAGQAFRYAATQEAEALANVRHALEGMGNLLAASGGHGLIARNAAPENSPAGQAIANEPYTGLNRRNQVNGQTWITNPGWKGISRDQYSGAFFGIALAYDLVPDPAVRAEARRQLMLMIDYIVGNDWIVDEDRRPWDVLDRTTAPTIWAGIGYQQLTFLLIGERVAPGRYAAELTRLGPVAETTWLAAWGGTFGLDHFYKFNLGFITYYNYFRLESDPTRWQDMRRAFRINQRYVGHHRNPHFDLIQCSVDPVLRGSLYPSSKEALRRFMRRKHRKLAPAVVDLSNVSWQTVTLSGYHQNGQGHTSTTTQTVQLPSEPLDPEIQVLTDHFLWQRNPFEPVSAGSGSPYWETLGVGLTLPYWMGRYYGAF